LDSFLKDEGGGDREEERERDLELSERDLLIGERLRERDREDDVEDEDFRAEGAIDQFFFWPLKLKETGLDFAVVVAGNLLNPGKDGSDFNGM
jgi:hypothetical protein